MSTIKSLEMSRYTLLIKNLYVISLKYNILSLTQAFFKYFPKSKIVNPNF